LAHGLEKDPLSNGFVAKSVGGANPVKNELILGFFWYVVLPSGERNENFFFEEKIKVDIL
jgi:hypothetical protein